MKRVIWCIKEDIFKVIKRYRVYGKEGLINKRAGAKKNRRRTSFSI
jgi:ribosomal protein S21